MDETVELRGVKKSFGSVAALQDLDLSVESGEMFALVGPDGAGKTTLLRILAGVLRQDAGEVRVLDRELPHQRREVKRHIGYLSQGFALYGDLSIDENLAFFAEIYGLRDYAARREELLQFTRLAPFRTRLAGRLSGGMKKKLALACALIHRPELILLDEPTTGVDPVSRRDFWVILGELLHDGLSIVVATPYLDEAERCTRVGLLDRGRFLTVGTPRKITGEFDGRLYEIVTPRPRKARAVLTETSLEGVQEVQAQGDRLHVRMQRVGRDGFGESVDREDNVRLIRSLLDSAGIPTESIRETAPTLENLFVSLITRERNR